MCPIHLYMDGSPHAAHRVSDDKSWSLSSVRFHLCPLHLYMEGSPHASHRVSDDKSWSKGCLQFDSIFVRYICTYMVHHTLHIGFQMTRVGIFLQFDSIFDRYICTWMVHCVMWVSCSVHTHSLWCDLIRAQPVSGQSIPLARVFPAVTLEDLVIYCKVTTFHAFLLFGLKL